MSDDTPIIPPRNGKIPLKKMAVERNPVHTPVRESIRDDKVDWSQWDNFELPDDDSQVNRLHIPKELIPDGMDYLWCTDKVHGQPFPGWRQRREMMGWRPVPAERYDGMFMPKGHKGEINIEDSVLMERPLEYSIRARHADARAAHGQVKAKEQQIRGGNFDNVTLDSHHPSAIKKNKISKSYERLDIEE